MKAGTGIARLGSGYGAVSRGKALTLPGRRASGPRQDCYRARLIGAAVANTATMPDVQDLVEQKSNASRRRSAAQAASDGEIGVGNGGPIVQRARAEFAAYFRVHDTLIGEPTPAVAYPHWSGKVEVRG